MDNENSSSSDDLIHWMMARDSGYDPRSPLPRKQQEAAQKERYRKQLKFERLLKGVGEALLTIRNELLPRLPGLEAELLMKQMHGAGELMASGKVRQPYHSNELGLSPKVMDQILSQAQQHFEKQQFGRASSLFHLLTIFDPWVFDYWLCAGICDHQLEKWSSALQCYARCIKMDGAQPAPYVYSAQVHQMEGQSVEARELLEKAERCLEKCPNPDMERCLGQIYRQLGGK